MNEANNKCIKPQDCPCITPSLHCEECTCFNNSRKCEKKCDISACPTGQRLITPEDGCCSCVPDEYCLVEVINGTTTWIKSGQTKNIDACSYWECTENCQFSGECQLVKRDVKCNDTFCDVDNCMEEVSNPSKCCKECRRKPNCQTTYTPSTKTPTTIRSTTSPCTLCQSSEFCCDNKCLSHTHLCDGIIDCSDNFDEMNCQSTTKGPKTTTCPGFKCSDGQCLPNKNMICDGKAQCLNHEDEDGCYTSTTTSGTSLEISNGTTTIKTTQKTPSGSTTRIGHSSTPAHRTESPITVPTIESTTTTEIETTKSYTSAPLCEHTLIPISCSKNGLNEPYDIDLGEEKIISGYKIAPNDKSFMKKFHIAFRANKSRKSKYEMFIDPQNDSPYSLDGNDGQSDQRQFFLPNGHVSARFVRIIPQQFATSVKKGFCLQVLGCEKTSTSQPSVSTITSSPSHYKTTIKVSRTTPQGSTVEISTPTSVPTTTKESSTFPSVSPKGSTVEITTPVPITTATKMSPSASMSTTGAPTTVSLPGTTTFCKDGKEERNETICHACTCKNKAWICETYCDKTCDSNEILIKINGACCYCSSSSTTRTPEATTTGNFILHSSIH